MGHVQKSIVGQSVRTLAKRINEHKRYFLYNNANSSYAKHILFQIIVLIVFFIFFVFTIGTFVKIAKDLLKLINFNVLLNIQIKFNNLPTKGNKICIYLRTFISKYFFFVSGSSQYGGH